MDANQTANRKRPVAFVAVVLAFVCSAPATRAAELVRTQDTVRPASMRSQIDAIEQSADGALPAGYGPAEMQPSPASMEEVNRAAVLAAILLIPPPVDLITQIPTPDASHPVVVSGPDLHVPTIPGGVNGQVLHTEGAPEPASLVLGLIGSSLAAAGAWYRRRKNRQAPPIPETV
jgi:hypothetical protein